MRIRTKFMVTLISVILITGGIVTAVTHKLATNLVKQQIQGHLETIAHSRAQHVETYLRATRREVEMMATSFIFKRFLLTDQRDSDHAAQYEDVTSRLHSMLDPEAGLSLLRILDGNGIVVASTDERILGRDAHENPAFSEVKNVARIDCPRVCTITGEQFLPVSAPIVENNELLGVVIASMSMSRLGEITKWGTGSGKTGEIYLVDAEGYMLTPSRFIDDTFLKQKIILSHTTCITGEIHTLGSTERGSSVALSKNYLDTEILGAHTHLAEIEWCLVAEQSAEEAFAPANALTRIMLAVFALLSVWGILLAVVASRTVTNPILSLRAGVAELGEGHLDHRVGTEAKDEIGELSRAFDSMAVDLKESRERVEDQSKHLAHKVVERTYQLAEKIEEGERQRIAILNIAQDTEMANLELEEEIAERVRAEKDLHRRDAILEAIGHASARLLTETKWEQNIAEVLARLGLAMEVSRVSLFKNHLGDDGDILISHLFEWIAPGIILPVDNSERKDFPLAARGFARWEKILSRGGLIQGHVRDLPPDEQKILATLGMKSTVVVPIFVRQEWWGFIAFDDYLAEHEWSGAEIEALKTAASLLGATIQRGLAEEEKSRLEVELRQSQKMEAIGSLAGGVAHDFNNILTVIQGYTEFALMSIGEDDPNWRDLNEVRRASVRAAALTRQLLLFSRRQPMMMGPLNLNEIIRNLNKMLARLIGEDITLSAALEPNLLTIEGDAGTIEQVLMNLVVNSRDAMDQGGEINIKTQNLHVDEEYCRTCADAQPGEFVCLSVTDTGTGISPDVMDHIFEPFFTTKERGKGTGMGLAVVYGIVRQHGGWIDVESSLGQGTTFRVYLPAVSTRPSQEPAASAPTEMSIGKEERILLVEDEESIRSFTTRGLSQQGYVVYPASSTQEALDIFKREDGKFDLIFCDLVLTDGSGLKLAQRLLELRPDTKVIFASGYSAEKEDWRVIHEEGYPFLQKPYSLSGLLEVVGEVLE